MGVAHPQRHLSGPTPEEVDAMDPDALAPDDRGVLEAARAIRPYLDQLVGPAAPRLDREIAEMLRDPAGDIARLSTVLHRNEDTGWFVDRVLADRPHFRPPYHQQVQPRDVPGPAGQIGRIAAQRYACPEGDYVWYRPDVGTQVPECPDHHLPLTRG
jgi:hypothetical protein